MKKDKVLIIIYTLILSIVCFIPIYDFKCHKSKPVLDLYRVYLDGRSIGVIKDKEKLEKYINDEQKDIKDKYHVDNVYIPKNLYISNYSSYDDNVVDEKDIYNKIKEKETFTIKGYVIDIKNDDDIISFNVLDKEAFHNAVTSVVKAFVSSDELDKFLDGENVIIERTGRKIEDLYVKENITITEEYIPIDEVILLDEKEITKYLLFGNDVSEKTYTVKAGDTVESIAEKNKLAVEELLVVNQKLNNKNTILSIGEEVSVALISPIITIVEEDHVVEEQVIKYTTEIKYDNSKISGYSEITQKGSDGLELVTQKIKYENGDMVNALIANTDVLTEAINEVKVIGTKTIASIDPSEIPDSGDWYWPTNKPYIITSPYGYRWGSFHDAVDISGTGYGSPIYAANNGVVYKVWFDNTGGYQIEIAHANGYYTWYAHLSAQYVKAGQEVSRGQKIGAMGSTGVSTGTHLHFATYKGLPGGGGLSFNPLSLYR